ncbi:uncharacterized protein KY384_008297 [Bacidia gigantensis]|uniref:uncharacterized protein n=1 Tax=Bacidia gigantensis TaxID=2732470 RepID=UPI001D03D787|nr:uncharacterized protein KY384_008297 [Bacidia gigantensis]KAG8526868.1 hypothetical protein KY384_008297 [Bacidia gigantensis]
MAYDKANALKETSLRAIEGTSTLVTAGLYKMADNTNLSKAKSEPVLTSESSPPESMTVPTKALSASSIEDASSSQDATSPMPSPNLLSRNSSMADLQDEWEVPPENITFFDLLDNLALSTKLESWQTKIARQTDRVRKQQAKLRSSTNNAKDRVIEEWRRRLPPPDEQLDTYRKRVRESVDRLGGRWNDAKAVTAREKLSFIAGVLNVFISGYLIGGRPEMFYLWFTAQLCYFMPIRYYTYHKRGYHYFLADMCYFVNLLMLLTIWVAPQSKRLFISAYCLANGNNAVAIAMWRNSMVFHSLDKVTSLFIHIMPCVTLHCLVHLTPAATLQDRFPAIYAIKFSHPESSVHYSLLDMFLWSSVPYAIWQLSYHFFITVRRREKIAAGRPTSFTWLRKSYGNSWIGKIVLGMPDSLQEPAFMLIQYLYAIGSMIPCPIWFWYRWPSATFLMVLFSWSIYNGATYYIDVFGTRFQKELEKMKKDVVKWQTSPNGGFESATPLQNGEPCGTQLEGAQSKSEASIDKISLLENAGDKATGTDLGRADGLKERK